MTTNATNDVKGGHSLPARISHTRRDTPDVSVPALRGSRSAQWHSLASRAGQRTWPATQH